MKIHARNPSTLLSRWTRLFPVRQGFPGALLTIVLLVPSIAISQQSGNFKVYNPVSTTANDQVNIAMVSDGSGGALIAWEDYRSNAGPGLADIYAQKVNATGVPQWTVNGIGVSAQTAAQHGPRITSDGSGGAIITWQDRRSGNYDIYAQRIGASGRVQWAANSVEICSADNDQIRPAIISDGDGGAIIAWQDKRSGGYDIYAQRVNASGVVQWAANGVAICSVDNDQVRPAIISDGNGGAIIAWQHKGSGSYDIYVQRVNANGELQWSPSTGNSVCKAVFDQVNIAMVSDASGGALLTWEGLRSDAGTGLADVYAQKVNATGVPQWTANGIGVSAQAAARHGPRIISDGSGGAIIAWQDKRSGSHDIYAQRVDGSGTVQWATNGAAICSADGDQISPAIISDRNGGAIIAWQDKRSGGYDVYAQRVDANGVLQWSPLTGNSVCKAGFDQINIAMVSDGSGGALLAWEDYRSNAGPGLADVCAQKVNATGVLQWTANGIGVCIQAAAQHGPRIMSGGGNEGFFSVTTDAIPAVEREVQFSVRAPKTVPAKRRVRETFPLRNYVFFDEGSAEIPNRYVALTKDQAASFKEEQLQDVQPISMTGRSARQMTVYYNILNILGDRMKRSPGTAIFLSGASEKGPEHGKARAEAIKRYLVDIFDIDGSRITTEGRDKPRIPSEEPGATKELDLLRAGDSRVDIESESPEMILQVGGGSHYMLKPVQIVAVVEDPLDSYVIFNVVWAKEVLATWSLEITDEQGKVQGYGPFTRDQETISGNFILGDRPQGDYTVVMVGQTKGGESIRKESSVHLVRRDEPMKEAVRFSILFDFDKSKTVDSYEKFLTDIVTPLIPDNGIVVIHGHTDIIGTEEYNYKLARERAEDAQSIIERALTNSGKHGVTFETLWFGADLQHAPFDNNLPEERFYNRTVIIDIVPD